DALYRAHDAVYTTHILPLTGALPPPSATIGRAGGRGGMRQHVAAGPGADPTVTDLLLSVTPEAVRATAREVDALELRLMESDDERTQMRYASALADYADAGGYDQEVLWDVCT